MTHSLMLSVPRSRSLDPANYCPVLVGAVAGARWGAVAISPEMLSDCGVVMRVQGADEILADGWI